MPTQSRSRRSSSTCRIASGRGTYERDALTHPYLAGHGYAAVRVDIRGSGESDGLLFDEYAQQEQDDALEVIAWLAAQPWCSGAVGMMGISWGGFNALQVAALPPSRAEGDHHASARPTTVTATTCITWAAPCSGQVSAGLRSCSAAMCHPPDPALVGDRWREMWLDRLNNLPLFLEPWMRHQWRDAYWKHGSVCEDYSAIQCPVYAVGGWTDGYTNAIPRLLEHLSVPRKGLIGPWAHAYPHFALPGPQIGFLQEALRWWDHWLKGIDTGVMDEPMLRAWMTESVRPAPYHEELPGRWIAEPSWPPPGMLAHRLFLTDDGLQPDCARLTPRTVCSPQTVGKNAGSWCPFGRAADQAGDQQEDDARSLVFETAPLDARIEILGAPIVTLDIAADQPLANLAVRLCDVHPDAASLRVSYGILNLTHRDGDETPVAAGAGTALSRAHPTQRCGLGVSGRASDQGGAFHHLLADDLAASGERNGDGVRRIAGTAGARRYADAFLPPLPKQETAPPERTPCPSGCGADRPVGT